MTVNSRAKGARAERELARALTGLGLGEARRGQQFAGGLDSPDVLCPRLSELGYHVEVKFYQNCQMFRAATVATWDAQATRDAGELTPVIAHRWNRQTTWWVRVLPAGRAPYWQTLEDFVGGLSV